MWEIEQLVFIIFYIIIEHYISDTSKFILHWPYLVFHSD